MSTLVEAEGLKKYFPIRRSLLSREVKMCHAVDGVDMHIEKGEIMGLVGESGCGKTTFGRLLLRLIEPTSGAVLFMGQNIFERSKREMRKLRCDIQVIFQNPLASLNPRKSIRSILSRPYIVHKLVQPEEIEERILKGLETVDLTPATSFIDRYPHELSGGQRQRIGIARVLALCPKFIVADEAVSSLDLSVRANILNLLIGIHKRLGLTMLYITHDLSVTRSLCQKVAVMYLGKIVELAYTDDLYENPLHPYTQALLSATPLPNPKATRARKRIILRGDVPSPIDPPKGCRFHTRCPYKKPECIRTEPNYIEIGREHFLACHLRA